MSEKINEACWYVVHTYSGYENKVKDTLEKSIKSNGMQDFIFEVRVPVEEVTEIRKGKRVKSQRKVFPGYVIVKMIKTNESWYVVRNTRGVTGFVGPDGQPVALTEAEIDTLAHSAFALTAELAVRFLTDYIDGDLYFKINYPGHNLVRTRCQAALAKDMEKKLPDMEEIVRHYVDKYKNKV